MDFHLEDFKKITTLQVQTTNQGILSTHNPEPSNTVTSVTFSFKPETNYLRQLHQPYNKQRSTTIDCRSSTWTTGCAGGPRSSLHRQPNCPCQIRRAFVTSPSAGQKNPEGRRGRQRWTTTGRIFPGLMAKGTMSDPMKRLTKNLAALACACLARKGGHHGGSATSN
jgi:hypothetical protein